MLYCFLSEEVVSELKREVGWKKTSVKLKKKCQSSKLPTVHQPKESLSNTPEDVTIDALVAILQDPDKGVPRAATNALKDIKVKKGSKVYSYKHTPMQYPQ